MALPTQKQLQYWGIAAVVFVVVLLALGNVLVPFLLGGAIAYFLDPLADWLEERKFSRAMATVTITLTGICIFILLFLLVLPTLIGQLGQLITTIGQFVENLPETWETFRSWLSNRFPSLDLQDDFLRDQMANLGSAIQSGSGELVNALLNSAQGIINAIVLVVIVPVVSFYLLMDWDRMVAQVDELLAPRSPRYHSRDLQRH